MSQALVLWLTGPPDAGKTTLAELVATHLRAEARKVEILDGDEVRQALSPGLGFSRADRDAHVGRLTWAALLVARLDGVAIVSAVSPYAAARDEARRRVTVAGTRFVEIHVGCPLAELERRDRKGLYARARAGQLTGLTGVSDPYEPPTAAEVVLDTSIEPPEASAQRILDVLACC